MKTMPKTTAEEKFRWIKPILDDEISIKDMDKVCPFCERSLKYWLKAYKEEGMKGLENKSRRPKSQPNETPIRIKERVIELRKETNLCALKLHWQLRDEGVRLDARTIGKIIKVEGLTRKYRTRKIQYRYIKIPLHPGEIFEMDIKYVPETIENMQYYQFTAIDCASRWRYIKIYECMSNQNAIDFLHEVIAAFPYRIKAIKTDNASVFTNRYIGYLKSSDTSNPRLHPLDLECQRLNIIHYLIDPGKPAQNGKVERSHRTDQESFYDCNKFKSVEELKYRIKLWNNYYNNLKHCALNGLTPNQALNFKVQNVRT